MSDLIREQLNDVTNNGWIRPKNQTFHITSKKAASPKWTPITHRWPANRAQIDARLMWLAFNSQGIVAWIDEEKEWEEYDDGLNDRPKHRLKTSGMTVYFGLPSDAMIYQLTWGGDEDCYREYT